MAISIVQLGSPRKDKGLRIGTVRRPPRGVRKEDYARLDYFDTWLPALSPSPDLVKAALSAADDKAWAAFTRKFKAEMKQPEAAHLIALLAKLSHRTDISVGCYCDDEKRCHRSVLRELLAEQGADIA